MSVGAGLYMYVVVVQKFTFAISSPDEFLYKRSPKNCQRQSCSAINCLSSGINILAGGGPLPPEILAESDPPPPEGSEF